MTLGVTARTEAAPNFLRNLEAAHLFFVEQDADSATSRFRKFKADLREMVTVVSWSPASGRPARFLDGRSAQARLRAESVQALALQAGLPNLREYVLSRHIGHIVLYAHSAVEAVFFALKHQRQLTYSAAGLRDSARPSGQRPAFAGRRRAVGHADGNQAAGEAEAGDQ